LLTRVVQIKAVFCHEISAIISYARGLPSPVTVAVMDEFPQRLYNAISAEEG
jgi:hypothetical protein